MKRHIVAVHKHVMKHHLPILAVLALIAFWSVSLSFGQRSFAAIRPNPPVITKVCASDGKSVTFNYGTSGATEYFLRFDTDTVAPHLDVFDDYAQTSWTKNNITPGTNYYFWVHAGNGGTNWSTDIGDATIVNFNCPASTPAPTVTVSITPSPIPNLGTHTVNMTSTNTSSCTWSRSGTYSGNWTNANLGATSYGQTVSGWAGPGTATYSFTCKNSANVSTTSQATVTIAGPTVSTRPNPPTITKTCSADGKSVAFGYSSAGATEYYLRFDTDKAAPHLDVLDDRLQTSWTKNNITPGTNYYFWVHAGNGGTNWSTDISDAGEVLVNCSAPILDPTVSVTITPSSVANLGAFTIAMSSTNASSCTWSRSGTYTLDNWSSTNLGATSYNQNVSGWAGPGTATYSFTCKNSANVSTTSQATITIAASVLTPSVTASITPASTAHLGTFNIAMTSANTSSCTWSRSGTYSGNWTNANLGATSYGQTVSGWAGPGTATYSFTCKNSTNVSTTSQATVTIAGSTVSTRPNPPSVSYVCAADGKSATFSYSSSGATLYYPRYDYDPQPVTGGIPLGTWDREAITTKTLTGLTPNTKYQFWVHAGNGGTSWTTDISDATNVKFSCIETAVINVNPSSPLQSVVGLGFNLGHSDYEYVAYDATPGSIQIEENLSASASGAHGQHLPHPNDEANWSRFFDYVDFVNPQFVRIGTSPTFWEPRNDNNDSSSINDSGFVWGSNFQTNSIAGTEQHKMYLANLNRLLTHFDQKKTYVMMVGWTLGNACWSERYATDGTPSSQGLPAVWLSRSAHEAMSKNPPIALSKNDCGGDPSIAPDSYGEPYDIDELAENIAAAAYYLRVTKGHTSIKAISIWNEPEGVSAQWATAAKLRGDSNCPQCTPEKYLANIYNAVATQLAAKGLRSGSNYVSIVGLDGQGLWAADPYGYDSNRAGKLINLTQGKIDVISIHDYNSDFNYKTVIDAAVQGTIQQHLINEYTLPITSDIKNITNPSFIRPQLFFSEIGSNAYPSGNEHSPPSVLQRLHNAEAAISLFNNGVSVAALWTLNNNYHPKWTYLTYPYQTTADKLRPDYSKIIAKKETFYPAALMTKYIRNGAQVLSSTVTGGLDSNGKPRIHAAVFKNGTNYTVLIVNDDSKERIISLKGLKLNWRGQYVSTTEYQKIYSMGALSTDNLIKVKPESITVLTTYSVGPSQPASGTTE